MNYNFFFSDLTFSNFHQFCHVFSILKTPNQRLLHSLPVQLLIKLDKRKTEIMHCSLFVMNLNHRRGGSRSNCWQTKNLQIHLCNLSIVLVIFHLFMLYTLCYCVCWCCSQTTVDQRFSVLFHHPNFLSPSSNCLPSASSLC